MQYDVLLLVLILGTLWLLSYAVAANYVLILLPADKQEQKAYKSVKGNIVLILYWVVFTQQNSGLMGLCMCVVGKHPKTRLPVNHFSYL